MARIEPLTLRDLNPRAILRATEARIAALNAEGVEPALVVMLVVPGRMPSLTYCDIDHTLLAFAATRLQLAALSELGGLTADETLFETEGGDAS